MCSFHCPAIAVHSAISNKTVNAHSLNQGQIVFSESDELEVGGNDASGNIGKDRKRENRLA